MQISNFHFSYIDYPGKISVILFFQGCNYRCPSCHAKNLLENNESLEEESFFEYLNYKREWVDGVVLCGGEPTIQDGLINFVKKIKRKGLNIKLDTNGNEPSVLEKLLEGKLIDYVAMDVKGPEVLYNDLTGRKTNFERIKNSLDVVPQFPDYEFRTTIVPVIRYNERISFMTPQEIGETAKLIYDCTGKSNSKYFLQKFVPHKGEGALVDSRLEVFTETPKEILEEGKKLAERYSPHCRIR
ncbi:MAG: anaerobic ribonucleoside-triphosphate reductase activating protein [Candidatus ainarchaeum sp.]|nr:anaerobic ribonucleoside-triphosphate reductase activating protein [Candidatus ainarchaeum sp.]